MKLLSSSWILSLPLIFFWRKKKLKYVDGFLLDICNRWSVQNKKIINWVPIPTKINDPFVWSEIQNDVINAEMMTQYDALSRSVIYF